MPPLEAAAQPVRRRRVPLIVRDARAGVHVDVFLVCAVVTILVIRVVLALTGYPRLGGGRLHIAHMLWGGLVLAGSLLLSLLSLSRRARMVAAFVGGVGFGFFIDELGKFLTRDNNYFYQPTIALMYFVFIVFFLLTRRTLTRSALTTDEYLANTITLIKEMALRNLGPAEKAHATAFLDRCDAGDSRVGLVRAFLAGLPSEPAPPPAWYDRLYAWLEPRVERVLAQPRFPTVLSIVFVGQSLFAVAWTVLTARLMWRGLHLPSGEAHLQRGFSEWAQFASTTVSTLLAVAGVSQLLTAPERAYRLLRLSLLVAIFLTQFFVFYDAQLSGFLGLGFNLVLLAAVQFLLNRHHRRGARARGIAPPAA